MSLTEERVYMGRKAWRGRRAITRSRARMGHSRQTCALLRSSSPESCDACQESEGIWHKGSAKLAVASSYCEVSLIECDLYLGPFIARQNLQKIYGPKS